MFLRKLTVILVPLGLLLLIRVLLPLFLSLDVFFGSLLLGSVLGAALGLLLPLAGATRMREPFAWLLWIPAAVILLVLLYQYLASLGYGLAPAAAAGHRGFPPDHRGKRLCRLYDHLLRPHRAGGLIDLPIGELIQATGLGADCAAPQPPGA